MYPAVPTGALWLGLTTCGALPRRPLPTLPGASASLHGSAILVPLTTAASARTIGMSTQRASPPGWSPSLGPARPLGLPVQPQHEAGQRAPRRGLKGPALVQRLERREGKHGAKPFVGCSGPSTWMGWGSLWHGSCCCWGSAGRRIAAGQRPRTGGSSREWIPRGMARHGAGMGGTPTMQSTLEGIAKAGSGPLDVACMVNS